MDGQNFNNESNQQPVTPEQPAFQQMPEQQPYAAPVQTEAPEKANGMSIAALVLGIVGIVLGCCSGIVGVICGVIGLILGILGNNKCKTKLGTAGIIVAGAAIGLSVISWILGIIMLSSVPSILNEMGYY